MIPAEGRDSDTALQPDGDGIDSPSGQYHLQYQGDGNLVLYDTWDSWTAVWATMTNDNNPGAVVMQGDGNFVIYNGDSEAVWATGTDGNSNAYLAVTDAGMLVIIREDGFALWWTPPPA